MNALCEALSLCFSVFQKRSECFVDETESAKLAAPMKFSFPALAALFAVWLCAFFPDARALPPAAMFPEKLTLLFLAVVFAIALIPQLHARLMQPNAAMWAILGAFIVLFHLADRAGPRDGFALTFPFVDEEKFPLSYAARAVLIGALLSAPAWWRERGAPERAFGIGVLLVGILGAGSTWVLSRFYPTGPAETLDPTSLGSLLLQLVTYGALALCCRAATAHESTRRALLRVLPAALLLVWARHQFAPIPAPLEEE